MVITSLENNKVKELVKLQKKKYRDLTDCYVVEGMHLVEEAFKRGVVLEVFQLEGVEEVFPNTFYVSEEVMKKISFMDTPSSIIALCKKIKYTEILGDKGLLLDEIQDPGNLGTIIRSAVAFGMDFIILSNQSVDLYNPKVLRATQGLYCHIPILTMDIMDAVRELKNKHFLLYGTNVVDGVEASSLSLEEKSHFCLVMGNEGRGVLEEIQKLCDKNLYIPMNKKVESLNVGVACSILLYELGR